MPVNMRIDPRLALLSPQGSISDMHFITAYEWARDVLKPVQLEYPDPPATFADFLRYNGFLNEKAFHIGTSPSVSCCEISIDVYQDEKTTTEIDYPPRFLASLDIAHVKMLVLLDSAADYISFLNTYSPLLTLALLHSINKSDQDQ
jgi:hypothetical protein